MSAIRPWFKSPASLSKGGQVGKPPRLLYLVRMERHGLQPKHGNVAVAEAHVHESRINRASRRRTMWCGCEVGTIGSVSAEGLQPLTERAKRYLMRARVIGALEETR